MNNSLSSLIKTYFETDETTEYSPNGEWKITTGGYDLVAEIYHVENGEEVPVCGIIDAWSGYEVQAYQSDEISINAKNDVINALRDMDMKVHTPSEFAKELKGFNRTNDTNGNAVIKAFYKGGTAEIIRGGRVNDFYKHYNVKASDYNKKYSSVDSLRKSKMPTEKSEER